MSTACGNCGNERVMRCIYCQDDGVTKEVDDELSRLRTRIADLEAAGRKLGAYVRECEDAFSTGQIGWFSPGDSVPKVGKALEDINAHPTAAGFVKEAGDGH